MSAPEHKHTLSYQLRETIESRGLSARELARLADCDHRMIGRFLRGERDLALSSADRIAGALGLRLVEVAVRGKGKRRGPVKPGGGLKAELTAELMADIADLGTPWAETALAAEVDFS